jgi:hypothetical protein
MYATAAIFMVQTTLFPSGGYRLPRLGIITLDGDEEEKAIELVQRRGRE